jgi:hypothetical protein
LACQISISTSFSTGADAVEDAAFDADLSPWSSAREDVAEVLLEDVEAGRLRRRPMCTYGPAVCDAVSRRTTRSLPPGAA